MAPGNFGPGEAARPHVGVTGTLDKAAKAVVKLLRVGVDVGRQAAGPVERCMFPGVWDG